MKSLPLDINNNERILVVSPHPDDESIGTGGLILLYGAQCTVCVMTDGRYGNSKYDPTDMKEVRRDELNKAMKFAGVSCVETINVEDGDLINHPEVFNSIHIEDYDMVFVTNPHDNHSDHTACYTYIINYVQKIKNKKIRVYIYEVHTPMADVDYYLDISEVIDKKKELISCYKSQMEIHNYSGQIEKLAEYRGYQNGNPGQLLEVYKEATQLDGSTIYSGIEKELAKYKAFTRILGEWVKCSDNSILVSFLAKRGYHEVAIYGFGILGKTLYYHLKNTGCFVKYIVDRDKSIECNTKVYHDTDDLEPVDLMIISAMVDINSISKLITERYGIKCLSIEQVISLMEGK